MTDVVSHVHQVDWRKHWTL